MSNEQSTLPPAPVAFTRSAYAITGEKAEQGWAKRHNDVIWSPYRTADESRILDLIRAVHSAAVAFPACGFGKPEVLLPMVQAARAALNFETGRLDCGTLDRGLVTLAYNLGIEDGEL